MQKMKKVRVVMTLLLIVMIGVIFVVCIKNRERIVECIGVDETAEHDTVSVVYHRIRDIVPPKGYERVCSEDGFANYLRELPLKSEGSEITYYKGRTNGMDCFRVVDMPLLSEDEQCADVVIHLRADYLFKAGAYSDIHFNNYSGRPVRYRGGNNKGAFEDYLRDVFRYANTYTLTRELEKVTFADVMPGDVFIYAGQDRGGGLGHAIVVLDVAKAANGKKVIVVAQGFTPACDLHVVDSDNEAMSPWIEVPANGKEIVLSSFVFNPDDLYRFW